VSEPLSEDDRTDQTLKDSALQDLEQRLGPTRYSLYLLVKNSPFCLEDKLEPTLDSVEGQAMLEKMDDLEIISALRVQRKSIYYLFIDEKTSRCLFCESKKSTPKRALSCVRSHLNHRPFQCPGESVSCKWCNESRG
jgi:hypothetical protein